MCDVKEHCWAMLCKEKLKSYRHKHFQNRIRNLFDSDHVKSRITIFR